MTVFGTLNGPLSHELSQLCEQTDGLPVNRAASARSSTPFPGSTDLEGALKPLLASLGYEHHVQFQHAQSGLGFEYDFYRQRDGVAMEVMGYRADDEVYKDIVKFHVHQDTRFGVLWVPRWKWIGGRRGGANYRTAVRALAFAADSMAVDALVLLPYDWEQDGQHWRLRHWVGT